MYYQCNDKKNYYKNKKGMSQSWSKYTKDSFKRSIVWKYELSAKTVWRIRLITIGESHYDNPAKFTSKI